MRQFLAILVTTLLVQSASAQSLWRNFFTTNRDPIVEVVAGSNATVQVTTVGSNIRRFTVNSTATGGGLAQTNISYEAVTNAPWQFGDSDLTNWATLNTNVLSTLGQTNISYVAVTNAPWQTGSVNLTNWSGISTNLAAFLANNQVFTGSNYFTQPLTLSLATNSPSAGQVLTATSASDAAWQIPSSGGGISSICNAQSISMPDSGPRYASISGAGAVYSIIGPVNVPVSFLASSATLGPFAVSFNSAYASGTNVTFTLMTNSVATHIAITINGGSTIGYSTGTVSITNGTPVAIKITSTLASAHTQSYWMFSVGLK